jgi:hypothetical protein
MTCTASRRASIFYTSVGVSRTGAIVVSDPVIICSFMG